MVDTMKYRVFSSSVSSQTGCNYRFLVGPDDLEQLPSVKYNCPRCKKVHPFTLEQDFIANTPHQRKTMRTWAQRLGIEIKTDL